MKRNIPLLVAIGILASIVHTNAADREMICSGFLTDMRTIGIQLFQTYTKKNTIELTGVPT
jgi:hypothetical protein